ncbi:acyltransferase family protein [Sphingobium boeckii]|uniref:Acyltransferase 3 domain-containing protein n=1 Tax=Sphingobium boeckii TaxID=1082345 RepID=A0A7W9AFI7_9SPHN|nr:acyltransferase family protein [Sphingobium boeckii]MBB5684566.1 hypothetical protein [Sphingobium boeckii]
MTTDSQHPVQAAPAIPRHFGLDWLRIGAFALLILYHIGMMFVTGGWLVKTDAPIEALSYPMLFVSPWRLGVLFIVSGYAARAMITKAGLLDIFAAERSKRLLIPLLFAMIFIIPPQSWVTLQFNHGYESGFWSFWLHDYFRVAPLHGVTLPAWEHLWFVFYLWLYTMLLVAGLVLIPAQARQMLGGLFDRLATGWRLLWMPLLYLIPMRIGLTFTTGESHGLFNDWVSDFILLPMFLFGFGLAGAPALWLAIARLWRPALVLSLVAYLVLAAVETAYPGTSTPPHATMALNRAAQAAMLWGMALVMLRLADTMLDRDHRWRARLSEAVFPFYIIHQSAIVLIGWWLLPLSLSPLAQFAAILAGTAASCWLFYDIGRRIGWLRPLIGLRALTRPMDASPSPVTGTARSPR